MRNNGFIMIKLPNGVYFLWNTNMGIDVYSLLFATRGVKSKGKTIVTTKECVENFGPNSIRNYLRNKNFIDIDRLFVCQYANWRDSQKSQEQKN